ncbi:MAG TPA: response regulator [Bacteroidales bacterium]|nr:response regulator [Bacteroidales bacterium]
MDKKINILHISDVPKNSEHIQAILTTEGINFSMEQVMSEKELIAKLNNAKYDIISIDYSSKSFNSDKILNIAKIHTPKTPVIVVSDFIGEEKTVEIIKQGATDLILKSNLPRIVFAINRAIKDLNNTKIEKPEDVSIFQTIIDSIPELIVVKNLNGQYMYINKAAEKAFGKKAPDLIGQDDSTAFQPGEPKINIEQELIEKPTTVNTDQIIKLYSGKVNTFNVTICPMYDEHGNTTGIIAVARDVTERKLLEQSLRNAKEKAEESDRLKSIFLHNISHEIRTPANAAIGFADFIVNPDISIEKRQHYANIISRSCQQILAIIADVVNTTTLESGKINVNITEVNINDIFRTLHAQFEQQAHNKKLELKYSLGLDDKLSTIKTDKTKLTEILSNLIKNAIKFTHEGHVSFGYTLKGEWLEFFVEDTGIGISEDMHQIIFERFRQGDSSIYQRFGGTGLGLAITKGYIEMLDGKIWVKSEKNQGSEFFFTLPYNLSKTEKEIQDKASATYLDELKTILVAEDEDLNYIFIKEILYSHKIRLIRAMNGKEAVDISKTEKIDLILMDIKMPVMDGLEATKKIRTFNDKIPIIAQTAFATDADKKNVFASGCNDFISKPFTKELLLSKVQAHLSQSL